MFTTILIAIGVSICLAAFCYRFTSSDLGETIMVASLYVAVFLGTFLVITFPIVSIAGGSLL